MVFENIIPAITKSPRNHDPITTEVFQKTLYSWFEEKGLISNLRSHLRVQMINHLKNTAIGKLDYQKFTTLSQQAFNLVIAEHLLREGFHYTLSVFSTEAPPVATQLPISTLEVSRFKENEKWRFDEESVENVLELIGISKRSEENLKIRTLYCQSDKSLLSLIISNKLTQKSTEMIINEQMDENEEFFGYFNRILGVLGAPIRVIHELTLKIQQYIRKENDEFCLKYQKNIDDLKAIIQVKDDEIESLTQQRIILKSDLKLLKKERKVLKERMESLTVKEEQLLNKEGILQGRIQEIDKLENELKTCLEKQSTECTKTHCSSVCDNNAELVLKLQQEIAELQRLNQEKITEIEKLQAKNSMLISDLKNSQIKTNLLSCCLQKSSEIDLVPTQDKKEELSESSDNSTENVLQEVRSRLLQLEKESNDLDVKYKQFKINNIK